MERERLPALEGKKGSDLEQDKNMQRIDEQTDRSDNASRNLPALYSVQLQQLREKILSPRSKGPQTTVWVFGIASASLTRTRKPQTVDGINIEKAWSIFHCRQPVNLSFLVMFLYMVSSSKSQDKVTVAVDERRQ
jgi:hypothetical protein